MSVGKDMHITSINLDVTVVTVFPLLYKNTVYTSPLPATYFES